MDVRLHIDGLSPLEQNLGKLAGRFGNILPLMERLGMIAESGVMDYFEEERGPDGKRWEPSIRARETGGKTLTDSARLKLSITHRASARMMEVGTNVKYARPHQEGATIRGKNGKLTFKLPGGLGFRSVDEVRLPARPFLGFSTDMIGDMEAEAESYAAEAAGGLAQ